MDCDKRRLIVSHCSLIMMMHASTFSLTFYVRDNSFAIFVFLENGENSKGNNGKSGGSSSSSKSKSSKPPKGSKSSKRNRWDFMLPMPATQSVGPASDSSVYRLQRHLKMSKLKGNGKQAYKVMITITMLLMSVFRLIRESNNS